MTHYIDIEVHLKRTEGYDRGDDKEEPADKSVLRVHIDDKVDKILTYLKLSGAKVGGEIMSRGKVIKKPEDKTFKKINVVHMQVFTIICKSSALAQPVRWVRFKKLVKNDYMFMGTSYYDGIVFIPKVNITFFGWGIFASYRGHDQTFNVRWKIDSEYSDKYEVSFVHSERDPEGNWHEVDLRNLGVSPIFVPAGTRLNVLAYP